MNIDQFNKRIERMKILLMLLNKTVPKREGNKIMIEGLNEMLATGKIFEESNSIVYPIIKTGD